ncbi:3'-5' exonuclease [Limisalsivibrio acetivorans]|uniref:3'-5' exonuclease n=1 Tax=Limisalsivibrio acetivorans TaxID=1304888 RepID=UPI0003B48044|nr:3'-5' exonuclease [Limisalsivibrio acetivorans]
MKTTRFDELTFTVFDTETTGISPKKGAKLLEIAAVRVEPGFKINLNERFETLIDPECSIPYQAYAVHGISRTMVKGKPTDREVIPSFLEFTGESIVAAHNARFDCSFIMHCVDKHSLGDVPPMVIDTVKLARAAFPGLPSYSLDSLMRNLELDVPLPATYRHRALFDAAHTALLLANCFKELYARGIETPEALYNDTKGSFYRWPA